MQCSIYISSLKPYNIKGKTVTTNGVDSTAVLLSVMIRQTISGLEGQSHLSGSCSTAGEIVEQLGKIGKTLRRDRPRREALGRDRPRPEALGRDRPRPEALGRDRPTTSRLERSLDQAHPLKKVPPKT